MHRTPFRPLWTELKGFGSRRTVAGSPDGVHDCSMALRRFSPKDVLRETFLTQLAVAPDGSSVGLRATHDRGRRVQDAALARAHERRTGGADHDRRQRLAASVLAGREDARLHVEPLREVAAVAPAARGRRAAAAGRVPGPGRCGGVVAGRAEHRRARPERRGAVPRRRSGAADGAADHGPQLAPRRRRACATSSRASGSSPPAAGSRSGSPRRATRSSRPSGARTVERIGFLADPRPEAGVLEQPQAWSMPADGGRADEARGAARRDRGRGVLAEREACLRRARRPVVLAGRRTSASGCGTGSSARRLGEELDRTFFFIVIGDLVDFGALAPVPVHLARRRERRRAGHRPRALRSVPLRARRLGRATGRARRRRLHVARGRRRPPRDDREHRRRRVRRLRDRGRRPAPAVAQRRQLVRPVPPRSGAPCGAPPRRARDRRLGRPASGSPQQGPGPPDPRRPALRARPRAVAGDGRARGRRLHGPLRQPAGLAGLRRGVRRRRSRATGARRTTPICMRLVDWAVRQEARDRATTSACSGSPTAAT